MANRKFHYQGKKNVGENRDAAVREQNAERGQERAKRPARKRNGGERPNGGKQNAVDRAAEKYPQELVMLSLAELGVGETLAELLAKNKIAKAGDLVKKTERDMFRVQGFNKKMLAELKTRLAERGMEFAPDRRTAEPSPSGTDVRPQQTSDTGRKKTEEFRRKERGRERGAREDKGREDRPKKLTEPLPAEEWRKIQKGGKWGFYDGFKTVIPAMYDEVFCFKEGLASVELEEKCGYITQENEIAIPFEYETAMSFSEGFASVVKGGKCGYINKNNEVVIPFIYDAATPFEDGEAKVKKDGKWGTVFPDGSVKWI